MSTTSTAETAASAETSVATSTILVSATGVPQQIHTAKKNFRVFLRTSESLNTASDSIEEIVEARRLYPHVFDSATNTGEAIGIIQSAIDDVRLAIDDFTDANLQSIGTRLSQIALLLKKAYGISHTNDPFAAVISFLRRATLTLSPEDVSLPQLNSLLGALKEIAENPLLNLDDATDLIDKLTTDGWNGEHADVEKIVAMLLDSQGDETEGTIAAMKKILVNEVIS